MKTRNLYLLALAMTRGLGPVTVRNLIAYCGSAQAVFDSPKGKLLRTPGVGPRALEKLQPHKHLNRAEKELAFVQAHDIQMISYLDPDYPQALKYIANAPLFLFKKGSLDLNGQTNIAIVGTRRASPYGKEMTRWLAQELVRKGMNVVSGLAYGIDITAHKAVLQYGGMTTAVLAHGLDRIYPEIHRSKAREMLKNGAWISEYLSGTEPDAPHFPARNRIISGICRAVIVVEAAETGGALITAKFALEQNREVYAIPGRLGDPLSSGCNKLIRDHGAKLLSHPQEIFADLEIAWSNPRHKDKSDQLELALSASTIPLTAEESKVMQFLSRKDAVVDDIAVHTGISLSKLNGLLLSMEFKELLRQIPGKKYQKC